MRSIRWIFPCSTLGLLGMLFFSGWVAPPAELAQYHLVRAHRIPGPTPAGRMTEPLLQAGEVDAVLPTLLFPHVGNGDLEGSDRFLQTTLVLVNTTRRPATGRLHFFNDAGSPMEVVIDGVSGNTFPVSLSGTGVLRLQTSGRGEVASGWARVESDQPLAGTATFGLKDEAGVTYADVGVAPAVPGQEWRVFADTLSWANTGIALANPSATQPLEVEAELWDPSGQDRLGQHKLDIPPRGHVAQFVTELFQDVPRIDELEGSVVLRSETPFIGTTLRTWGELLTGMPMAAPAGPGANWTKLAFPHVGDGRGGDLKIRTSVVLFNTTESDISGHIDFYRSDASSMEVVIGSRKAATFDVGVPAGGVARWVTSGTPDLQIGWAEVEADGPLLGTAVYTILDRFNRVISEVGVPAALLYQTFDLIADTRGDFNTGIAVANPSSAEAVDVRFELLNRWGYFERGVTRRIPPRGHSALFLTELFSNQEDIDEFEGLLQVTANRVTAYERSWIAPICLRQSGTQLTSLPTLTRQYGFSPTTSFEFAQQVAGTAPGLRVGISQRSGEWATHQVSIFSPQFRLLPENLPAGRPLAGGFVTSGRGDQLLDLVTDEEDPARFQLYNFNRQTRSHFASGRFVSPESGGAGIELEFLGQVPETLLATDAGAGLVLPARLFEVIPDEGAVEIRTEFRSVPVSAGNGHPLLLRHDQAFWFTTPMAGRPVVTGTRPTLLERGAFARIEGTGFGPSPRVRYQNQQWEWDWIGPVESDPSGITVIVPWDFGDEEFQVFGDDDTSSNDHLTWFGPSPATISLLTERAEGVYDLKLLLKQRSATPIPKLTRFRFRLFDADCRFSDLAEEQVIGAVTRETGESNDRYRNYPLTIQSVEPSGATARLASSSGSEIGTLTIRSIPVAEGQDAELILEFTPVQKQDLLDLGYAMDWDWTLTALPLSLPDSSGLLRGLMETESIPKAEGGTVARQRLVMVVTEPGQEGEP